MDIEVFAKTSDIPFEYLKGSKKTLFRFYNFCHIEPSMHSTTMSLSKKMDEITVTDKTRY